MKRWEKVGICKDEYRDILREINQWEEVFCQERDEDIDDLAEVCYLEILDFMAKDGFDRDIVSEVMWQREGDNLEEWKSI